jgi:uncharacterized protein YjdB
MKRKMFLIFGVLLGVTLFTGCKKDEPVALAGITISKTATTLKPALTEALSLTFFPENAASKDVIWASSNPAVATVDNAGLITAVSVGTSTISVTHTLNAAIKSLCEVSV